MPCIGGCSRAAAFAKQDADAAGGLAGSQERIENENPQLMRDLCGKKRKWGKDLGIRKNERVSERLHEGFNYCPGLHGTVMHPFFSGNGMEGWGGGNFPLVH